MAKKGFMELIDPMGTLKFSIEFVVLSMIVGALAAMAGLEAYLVAPMAALELGSIVGLLVVVALAKVVDDKIPM